MTSPIVFDADPTAGPLAWNELFDRVGPVELEIGFGKGRSLLDDAAAHPERNYVGVELARPYVRLVARRVAHRGLTNVRLTSADAGEFLRACVPAASLAAVRAYCPDPWHKKRHHKRRLFTYGFLAAIAAALEPGGHFLFVSDHAGYFEEVAEHAMLLPVYSSVHLSMRRPQDGLENTRTNYERKWLSLGRPVYTLVACTAGAC